MIRPIRFLAPLIAIAASFAAPAQAQTANDLQCLAAMSIMAGAEERALNEAGTYGTIYFAGKLLGRDPLIDLETALLETAGSLSDEDYERLNVNCLGELEGLAQRLMEFGGDAEETP